MVTAHMQKASSLTEFSQKWAIQALTVNQSIHKKVRYSEGSSMTHFSSQRQLRPQTTAMPSSEAEDAESMISPCPHSTGGMSQYQDGASAMHRGHWEILSIPCLAKQAGRSESILRMRLLGSECQSAEASSHSEPSKELLKAGQVFTQCSICSKKPKCTVRSQEGSWALGCEMQVLAKFVTLSTEPEWGAPGLLHMLLSVGQAALLPYYKNRKPDTNPCTHHHTLSQGWGHCPEPVSALRKTST